MMLLLVLLFLVSASAQQWQDYIVGPQSLDVYPVAIISSSGSVTNPQGLLPDREGDTTLTRAQGEDPPSVIVDFGLNTVGFLNISFNGASDNNPGIRLAFSETMQYLSDLSDFARSNMANPITPGSDQIAVRAQPYTWTATWGCENETKVCSDGLHGFRYLKIYLDALEDDAPLTSSYGTVNISAVSLTYSGFLPTPETFIGNFLCSDDELNRYWYSAVYTNDLTTDYFRETDVDPRGAFNSGLDGLLVLFDGAKRDRDPYVGDVAISGKTAYLSHGNLSGIAAKNVLVDLANHQRGDGWIPPASVMDYTLQLFDYPLWWVIAVRDYQLYINDGTLVQSLFPNMVRVFEDYYAAHTNPETQLISKPDGEGDFAFVPRSGECAYYNALYVLGLKAAAEVADFLGNHTLANVWLDRADNVSIAFNDAFWDESVGAYRNSKTDLTSHPQDGNALAIMANIASIEQAKSALLYLNQSTSRPYGNAFMDDDSLVAGGSQRVYAFMSNFEISARFEMGEDDSAIDEIKRLYGWMQTHDPNVTYWEGIGADGSMYQGGFTSAAHGWSSGVVGLLTNYVLGLQWLDLGQKALLSSPHFGDMSFARGAIPTSDGAIQVEWSIDGEDVTYKVEVPKGVSLTAEMPLEGDNWSILHNGETIWKNGKGADIQRNKGRMVLPKIGEGEHVIVARKS